MPKFRKLPVEIEAFQLANESNLEGNTPDWFIDLVLAGIIKAEPDGVIISTLEGAMKAQVGDFIIQGVKGEVYPCKPDIFFATYEAVD